MSAVFKTLFPNADLLCNLRRCCAAGMVAGSNRAFEGQAVINIFSDFIAEFS